MKAEEWDSLEEGDLIYMRLKHRPRRVMSYDAQSRSIKLRRISGLGTTTYCNGDKYLFTILKKKNDAVQNNT